MIDQVIALILAATCLMGTLSQYDQASTETVLHNRSMFGQTAYTLPEDRQGVTGYIAVYECERIGEVVTVSWANHVESLMVFDCAGDDPTRQWMKQENVIGEVDYYTAQRWGMLGFGMVRATICPSGVERHQQNTLIR